MDNEKTAEIVKTEKKSTAKKVLLIVLQVVFLLLCAALLAYSAFGIVNYKLTLDRLSATPDGQNGVFNEIDFNKDVTTEEAYLSENLYITYTNEKGTETETITDGNYKDFGYGLEFFAKYFEKLKNGEYRDFDTLFTNSYFNDHEHTDISFGFTKQGIYDIKISFANKYTENKTEYSTYAVDYKIYKNDGTFRNDIGPDEYRTQYITLAKSESGVFISRIAYSYDPDFDYSKSSIKSEIIAGAVSVSALILYIVLIIILKKKKGKKK